MCEGVHTTTSTPPRHLLTSARSTASSFQIPSGSFNAFTTGEAADGGYGGDKPIEEIEICLRGGAKQPFVEREYGFHGAM